MKIKNLKDLYWFVKEKYGTRGCWISDLSTALGISRNSANVLTLALGFRRGKCCSPASYEEFSENTDVQRVWATMRQ